MQLSNFRLVTKLTAHKLYLDNIVNYLQNQEVLWTILEKLQYPK